MSLLVYPPTAKFKSTGFVNPRYVLAKHSSGHLLRTPQHKVSWTGSGTITSTGTVVFSDSESPKTAFPFFYPEPPVSVNEARHLVKGYTSSVGTKEVLMFSLSGDQVFWWIQFATSWNSSQGQIIFRRAVSGGRIGSYSHHFTARGFTSSISNVVLSVA